MLLNHTGCGFTTFTDAELNAQLSGLTGDITPVPMRFFAYEAPEQHTREQLNLVSSHPWIAKEIPVRGFVFDVNTGRLREVMAHSRSCRVIMIEPTRIECSCRLNLAAFG